MTAYPCTCWSPLIVSANIRKYRKISMDLTTWWFSHLFACNVQNKSFLAALCFTLHTFTFTKLKNSHNLSLSFCLTDIALNIGDEEAAGTETKDGSLLGYLLVAIGGVLVGAASTLTVAWCRTGPKAKVDKAVEAEMAEVKCTQLDASDVKYVFLTLILVNSYIGFLFLILCGNDDTFNVRSSSHSFYAA